MTFKNHPKLLVATEFSPNASGGGAAVVRQMLRDWPSEKLLWWSCLPDFDDRFGQRTAVATSASIPVRLLPQKRFTKMKSALLENFWSQKAARHLQKFVEREQPDAIWVIPHNWSITPIYRALTMRGLPYHASIHDYVDAHGSSRIFGEKRCERFRRQMEEIYSRATSRDVICEPMGTDLLSLTGKAADFICRKGLEPEHIEWLDNSESMKTEKADRVIRLAYAGTILVPKEFALLVQALESLQPELKIELHFFGAHDCSGQPWFRSWMRMRGNFSEEKLRQELLEMDWGISLMALTDHDPAYNRFSFPAKFCTYFAAGLPVITLAHPESSVMKMARSYQVGFTSSSSDPESLRDGLKKCLELPKHQFRSEIVRCAQQQFDAAAMRGHLSDALRRSTNGTR